MNSSIFTYTDSQETSVEALQERLLTALEAGEPRLTLDIDGLPSLDVGAIRGLITLLRRVRDAGGELMLRVTRDDLKRTLGVTALDRVFTIASPAGVAA
ncbi:MAG TPA: STAS domain-containing protein [Candidatus Baltobacteraceae bacterium]